VAFALKMTVFWDVAPCSLVETGRHFSCPDDGGSKYLWNIGQFLPDYIPEDSHLHTCRRENLKSHTAFNLFRIHTSWAFPNYKNKSLDFARVCDEVYEFSN
jgi:hypothetical protein